MKKLLYIFIAVFGAILMSSCTGSARMAGGMGYGYYDDVYFYGHPGVFRSNVFIHNARPNVIVDNRGGRTTTVAPNNKKSERAAARRAQVQQRQSNTQNQRVAPARSNTNVNRSAAPSRVQGRSTAPARSAAPARSSGRGGR